MRLGYEALSYLSYPLFTNRTSASKGTQFELYLILFVFFLYSLYIFIFDVYLEVYFGLQFFLFNL